MLYLLFPKGNIEDFLSSQGDHANLSINYLQNMILYHPKNIDLKMILMEKYTQTGQNQEALAINQALIANTQNKKLLTQLRKVEYLLEKALYFEKPNTQKLIKLKKRLLDYYEYSQENRDYLFFFAESSNIDYGYLKYDALVHYMEEHPEVVDYGLEKMAFDLANKLNYQEASLTYLEKLIKYPELNKELSEYLVYSLFERNQFTKARKITTKLFLQSQTDDERTKFFHLALYTLAQDKTKTPTDISKLIQDYANLKDLLAPDIVIILNTLIELGKSKEAATFAINMFYSNPESFDETGIDMAIQSLLWNAKLEHARAFSFFAEGKFEKQKYLDKTIQISTWLGENDAVTALNEQGYYKYNSKIYEMYFLNNKDLDANYKLLGEIYKKKVRQKAYKFIENMAMYYEHTGEIPKAEAYFTKLYQTSKQKTAAYHAIAFSYKNSHFEKGLKLYKAYQSKYGIDPILQDLSIKRLLALKRFDEAYALTKATEKKNFLNNKQRFTDLAWLEKDYVYLYQKFWDFEAKNQLNATNYEHFLLLEKSLNYSNKIEYLYQQAWKKTHNGYYLSSLMYKLLEKKKFDEFQRKLNGLTQKENTVLEHNIEFQTLLAQYYIQQSNISLALKSYEKIFKLAPNKISSHQSYLWLLLDNQAKNPKLSKKLRLHLKHLKRNPKLREQLGMVAVVAAMSSQKYSLAKKWISKLLEKNPHHQEYISLNNDIETMERNKRYETHNKMLHPQHLKRQININKKHLGLALNVTETDFSYQWKLYQNIKSKIMLKHYEYKNAKGISAEQTAFEIALKNSNQSFLWDFSLTQTEAKKDFTSASLNLGYRTHNFNVSLDTKYQNKTTLTPKLEQNALENALALNVQAYINQRTSFSFTAQKSEFETLHGLNAGEAKRVQLNANYILRSGYPDITFNSYLNHNQFSKNISQDFSEFGLASSVGTARQQTLNSSWKPFGTVALAINDDKNLGGSLTLGVSKMLTGDDSLDVLLDYYNGIGVISEPIYGLNVKYRF
ncbi:MAG: Extracellular Matrix protein PelB [uncultured Sulfurovum sp.]|uniref:Extracellular Matrix protein PelB n=1 Tax=uncultured Sulfurovum sp. TaxID=269237 RepID=A0A6S6SXQ6_9BACT|nr:MAG: Extracellular Matrix protein PelB [uncultured Sulfurovum sp.]